LRKTLGQYEIAVLQATAIDQAAGVVKPTTALCHSSGEWVGSTWPVCSLEDMASPKRMGAALTYARRYALFALVAIAGEDDLDAPDLNAPAPAEAAAERPLLKPGARPTSRRKYFGQKIAADRVEKEDVNSANADSTANCQLCCVTSSWITLNGSTRLIQPLFGPVVFFQLRTR
jgi:hypothetical protein